MIQVQILFKFFGYILRVNVNQHHKIYGNNLGSEEREDVVDQVTPATEPETEKEQTAFYLFTY